MRHPAPRRMALAPLFALLLLLVLLALGWPAASIAAGTWHVATSGSDANDCLTPLTPCATIGAALGKASDGDTIKVGLGLYNESLTTDKSVTITGFGPGLTTISGFTIVSIGSAATATIANLTLADGAVGVSNAGTLTLTNVTVTGNRNDFGAGIRNSGTMTINSSNIHDNRTNNGIAISNSGTMTINDSTIHNNRSIWGTAGIYNFRTMIINRSFIHDNITCCSLSSRVGGITNEGDLTITDSTIARNRGEEIDGIENKGTLLMTNSTLSNDTLGNTNSASAMLVNVTVADAGVANYRDGTLRLHNTLIASSRLRCSGQTTSLGNNLISNGDDCNLAATSTDQIGSAARPIDPLLEPLADNGGPTPTHALRYLSPAIDNADPDGCPPTDQRGVTRPQDGDGNGRIGCDIGAFEREPTQTLSQHGYLPLLDR